MLFGTMMYRCHNIDPKDHSTVSVFEWIIAVLIGINLMLFIAIGVQGFKRLRRRMSGNGDGGEA